MKSYYKQILILLLLPLLVYLAYPLLIPQESEDMVVEVVEDVEDVLLPPEPVFNSCEIDRGGVVLMFDDLHVDSWYQAHLDIFKPNDIKATFYLTRVFNLEKDPELLAKILEMQEFGHEMGNHTTNHLRIEDYLLENTVEDYIDDEVMVAQDIGDSLGLPFYSFAYRGGVGNDEVDEILLEHFKTIRYTSGRLEAENEEIFYKDACERILGTGSIDFRSISQEDVTNSLERASADSSVVIVLGHDIIEEYTEERKMYKSDYEMLNHLINEAERLDLEFFTVSEVFSGN